MNSASNPSKVQSALERLYARHSAGIKFDLDPMRQLLRQLGDPQDTLAGIHVAGTNGKGSVCAMLDAVLQARGLRPGRYTSPHLLRFNERIQLDGLPIDDAVLAPLIETVEQADRAAAALPGGRLTTFFEFTTALAFLYFKQQGVRIVVIETGMGGRLDATNLLTPVVAVITRIGMDHSEWLGTTLEAVAREKAGIIKPGRPLVCGAMPDAARGIIAQVAAERGVSLISAEDTISVRPLRSRPNGKRRVALSGALMDYGTIAATLSDGYQLENLATALAALETFSRSTGIEFEAETVARGLQAVRWPGRLQMLCGDPPVLLDGAHNPDGVKALMHSLPAVWKGRPLALVTGVCADKDFRSMLRIFRHRVTRCWTVTLSTPRSLPGTDLAAVARQSGDWEVTPALLPAALTEAVAWARARGGNVLIAGSLFLAADVLRLPHDVWIQPGVSR